MGKKWIFRSEGKNEIARPTPDKAFYFKDHKIVVTSEEDARLLRQMGYEEVTEEDELVIPPEIEKKIEPGILKALKKLAKTSKTAAGTLLKTLIKQVEAPYAPELQALAEELIEEKPQTKAKVYVCPVEGCGKKFTSKKALDLHMKTAHGK